MAMTKVKKLQMWCKTIVDGYRDVSVTDMTSSWKDGLACCAIIHRYRPDLIDFDSLSKENVLENNRLAFEIAENELGIPALLEAEDMVAIRVPDRLSVVTYVSQYYNYFHDKPQLGGPGVRKTTLKRQQSPVDLAAPKAKRLTKQTENIDQKTEKKGSIGDKCTICHEKVYLMERLMDDNKLYHRACFRQSDLSHTSKMYSRPCPGSPDQTSYLKQRSKGSEKATNLAARLNELKKVTASPKPSVAPTYNKMDTEDYTQQKQLPSKSDVGSRRTDVKGGEEFNVSPKQQNETRLMDTSPVSSRVKSPVISHVKSPRSPRDKPLISPRNKSPETTRSESPESGGKLKPRAAPRGSLKSKDSSKPVVKETESVAAPPRKKFPKSSVASSGSPPPLPKSTPPSLAGSSLVPTANIKDSPMETHPSTTITSNRSPPASKFRFPSDTDTRKESSKPQINMKSERNGTNLPTNSKSSNDLNSKNSTVVSSKIRIHGPSVDDMPPQKPPRSLPRGTTPKDMEQAVKLSDPEQGNTGSTQPKEGKNVLKGLLKNLANVRNKGDNALNQKDQLADDSNFHGDRQTNDKSHADRPTNDILSTDRPTNGTSHADKPISDTSHADRPTQPRILRKAVIPPSKPETAKSAEINSTKVWPPKQTNENKRETEVKSSDKDPPWKNLKLKKVNEDGKKQDLWRDDDKTNKITDNKDSDIKTIDKIGVKMERPPRPKTPEIVSRKQVKDDVKKWYGEKTVPDTDTQTGADKSVVKQTDKQKPTEKQVEKEERKAPPIKNRIYPPSDTDKTEAGYRKKKIAVNIKFDFEDPGFKEGSKSPPPRPPQPSPNDIKEPRRSIKKHKGKSVPGSPGSWVKDGDFRKMSPLEIQTQLAHIDTKLTDLEVRGRRLEDSIRKAVDEDETMMMEWFQMVNEKNELVRKEADLIYASRTQELEDEQQDIDRQIRELLEKPDGEKTEEERQEEELLLQKLIDVVNQRSIIVDSQDDDRIRYLEEDRDIAVVLESKGYAKKVD